MTLDPRVALPDGAIKAMLPLPGGQLLVVEELSGMFAVVSALGPNLVRLARCAELDTAVDEAVALYRRQR